MVAAHAYTAYGSILWARYTYTRNDGMVTRFMLRAEGGWRYGWMEGQAYMVLVGDIPVRYS